MTALPLVGAGREADVFRWDAATVCKLWRDPTAGDRADREQTVTRLVATCGAPSPPVGDRVCHDGRPGLLLGYLPGSNLHQIAVKQPWKFRSIASRLAQVQARVHALAPPPDLPRLADEIAQRLAASPADDEMLERLAIMPDPNRLCHGNFHLANIIGDAVLDWADAARGDPHAEVAQSIVRYHVARLVSDGRHDHLERTGRSLLRGSYLRAYNAVAHVDDTLLAKWIPIRAAERLAEGIPGEAATLQALIGAR